MSTTFPSLPIWSDAQLRQWESDAIGQISADLHCIWAREALRTQTGISVITLPSYVRTVRRVTWRGKSLDPANWEELTMLTPATVFLAANSTVNVESSVSRPLYYAMHPTNLYDIRLYPTPNESFAPSDIPDVYAPQANQPACVIDYYREADQAVPQTAIPPYIFRRTMKAYVLWKAFAAEGKGQLLRAAAYYMEKYQFLIEQFRSINEGCFVGKKYAVEDGMLTVDGFKYPKPLLPPSFEAVIY